MLSFKNLQRVQVGMGLVIQFILVCKGVGLEELINKLGDCQTVGEGPLWRCEVIGLFRLRQCLFQARECLTYINLEGNTGLEGGRQAAAALSLLAQGTRSGGGALVQRILLLARWLGHGHVRLGYRIQGNFFNEHEGQLGSWFRLWPLPPDTVRGLVAKCQCSELRGRRGE